MSNPVLEAASAQFELLRKRMDEALRHAEVRVKEVEQARASALLHMPKDKTDAIEVEAWKRGLRRGHDQVRAEKAEARVKELEEQLALARVAVISAHEYLTPRLEAQDLSMQMEYLNNVRGQLQAALQQSVSLAVLRPWVEHVVKQVKFACADNAGRDNRQYVLETDTQPFIDKAFP